MSTVKSILGFKINNELFSIELFTVKCIILFTELKPIPGMPDYFAGLLNVHGKNIPVIDLCKRLGLKHASAYSVDTPIIIVEDHDHEMGLIVDEITDIDYAKTDNLSVNESNQNTIAELNHGIVHTKEGDALLLNINNLFEEAVTV